MTALVSSSPACLSVSHLAEVAGARLVAGDPATPIVGLSLDSRTTRPEDLFAALPGTQVDGTRFIPAALSAGAVAVLMADDAAASRPAVPANIALLSHPNPRLALAKMAGAMLGAEFGTTIAVTGTNGKSSTVHFLRELWTAAGYRAAGLGTLGIETAEGLIPGQLTTPDVLSLHRTLADLHSQGLTHQAFEASSHGLHQYRLDGIQLAAAAFTNLSRDHLDYHGTMAAYFEAKARLLIEVLPEGRPAVIVEADAWGRALSPRVAAAGRRVIRCGRADDADLQLTLSRPTALGQRIALAWQQQSAVIDLALMGVFQADNVLAALALALETGVDWPTAIAALPNLTAVRGRMERVAVTPQGVPVLVDYAHTPDALATALAAVRPHTQGRLIAVFGAGGDRDPGKRPLMGAAVAEYADLAIVTDDNPRSEDPAAIRAAVRAACPEARDIGDRAEAIAAAIDLSRPGDLIMVAGKGHEVGQERGGTVIAFSDHQAIIEALA